MATTILLIRHAAHDRPGPLLVGRDDSVDLSPAGRRDAELLAGRLARVALGAVLTSPSRRCQSTAGILATPHGLPVEVDPDLDEIDFGAWRGRRFADLDCEPAWQRFNHARGTARIPGGETIVAVQARVERALHRICDRRLPDPVAVVSHGDVIRTALCRALALPTDLMLRLDVAPASVSTIELEPGTPRVRGLNWRAGHPRGAPD